MSSNYPKITKTTVVSCYPANLPGTVLNQNQTKYVLTLELTIEHENTIQKALDALSTKSQNNQWPTHNDYVDWPEVGPITKLPLESLKITDLSSSKNTTKSHLEEVLASLHKIKNSL